MITFERDQHVGLVTQREHARLSRMISDQSDRTVPSPLRLAIRHHDDGWKEFDDAPRIHDGTIMDYRSVPLEEHLTILSRSVQRTREKNPYAAWLVSRHGCSFHEDKSGRLVEAFLEEQKNLRKKIRQNHELPADPQRKEDFNWLQFVDALSLYVLNPWNEKMNWNRRPPGESGITPIDGNRYRYEGAGFSSGPRTFTVDCKYVSRSVRSGTDRLRKAYRSATVQSRTVTIEFRNPER